MTLADNIYRLTQSHATRRADGKITKNPALIDQLADAVHTSRGGKRDSTEPQIPINTTAIDLWRHLDNTARDEELHRTGTMRGTLGSIITAWGAEKRPEWVTHLDHLTLDIIDRIQHLIDPPPKRRKLHRPCPSCGQQWETQKDGNRTPCLTAGTHDTDGTLRHPSDYDITCTHCHASWIGHQLTQIITT